MTRAPAGPVGPIFRISAFATTLLLLGCSPGSLWAETASDARADGTFLPFVDGPAPGQVRTDPPKLHVVLGGRRITAVVDTGSTGLVVAASAIPGLGALPRLGPARLTYSSSGRVMEGDWVLMAVTVAGQDGTRVTTEPMPVLAVTRIACLQTARHCSAEEHPSRVAMLGVGYAREVDDQAQGTPDRNPFLRTESEASGLARRGYVLTRDGVTVGLPAATPDAGFDMIRLAHDPKHGDWQAPSACLSIDHRTPPACGALLVDTGIARSFLTADDEQLAGVVEGTAVRAGTRVTVQLGAAAGVQPAYSFQVGDRSDPLVPTAVTVVRRNGPAFLNTGVHFLNGFDVLFDADQGVAGYRATQNKSVVLR